MSSSRAQQVSRSLQLPALHPVSDACITYWTTKNIFWTDSLLWLSSTYKMANGKNNQKKAAHLSQPKTIFRLSKLEASPPCFPQVSPAERFYREEIMKTSGTAMEIVLTHSNLNHNFFTVAYLQFLWNHGKYIFFFLSSQLGSIFGQAFTRVKANY